MPQTFCTKCGYELYSLGLDSEGMAKCPECGGRVMPSPWQKPHGRWAFRIAVLLAQTPLALACLSIFAATPGFRPDLIILMLPPGAVISLVLSAGFSWFVAWLLQAPERQFWKAIRRGIMLTVSIAGFTAFAVLAF